MAKYQMPAGLDGETAAWLQRVTKIQDDPAEREKTTELTHLRWWYESSVETTSETFFPRFDGIEPPLWRKMRRLIPRVNLLRPCVSTLVSAVYSGDVVRTLSANPYPELQKFIDSPAYNGPVTKWAANALLYGTALAVPQVLADGRISIYLPDPVHTYIWTDPLDIYRIVRVAEVTKNSIRYFTLTGYGVAFSDKTGNASVHVPCNYGEYLPVAYAAGEDCRVFGRIYGVSAVRDALYWSIALGDCLFKVRLLQAKETRNLLVIIGDEEVPLGNNVEVGQQGEPITGSGEPDRLKLSIGSDAKFIKPDPEIESSLAIARSFIGQLATAIGIPADSLDANYSLASASAEAARIRAIPLLNKSKLYCQQYAEYETELIFAITAALEYAKTQLPLKLSDLRKRVETQIQYNPYVLPQSPNEVTADVINQWGAGLISSEEAVRRVARYKTPEQVAEQAAKMEAKAQAAGGAAAQRDQLYKAEATQRDAQPTPNQQ